MPHRPIWPDRTHSTGESIHVDIPTSGQYGILSIQSRARRSGRTGISGDSLQTNRSRRTRQSRISFGALRTSRANWTLQTRGARRSLWSDDSLDAGSSVGSARTLNALKANFALGSSFSRGPYDFKRDLL